MDFCKKIVIIIGILALASINSQTNLNSASAESTIQITSDFKSQPLSGVSRSVDPFASDTCTKSSYSNTCLDFTNSKPKVVTIFTTFKTKWLTYDTQTRPWKIGETKLTEEGNNAVGKVISFTDNSITFEFTPLKSSSYSNNFSIAFSASGEYDTWNNTQAIRGISLMIIVGKNAGAVLLLDCPQSVEVVDKNDANFQVKSNYPADVSYSMYPSINSNKTEYRELTGRLSPEQNSVNFILKTNRINNQQEKIYIKATAILNQPFPIEIPPAYCQITIVGKNNVNRTYSWTWSDGTQVESKKYTLDELKKAYLVVKYFETDKTGRKISLKDYSNPTPTVFIDRWTENGNWIQVGRIKFTFDGKNVDQNGFDLTQVAVCNRSVCLGNHKIRLRSDDGFLSKELQVTFNKGFFDFKINAPSQVEWGQLYKVSIKANKSLAGTCNYSSYFRGTIDQGSSPLSSGISSKSVKFLWGEEKSTTVQLTVKCSSQGFTVTKSLLIRAFRK